MTVNIDIRKGALALAVLAVAACFIVSAAASAVDADGEDLSDEYGVEATDVSLAPGYSWSYTVKITSSLADYVTISLEVNDSSVATLSGSTSGSTVKVTIPSDASAGDVYNVVIKAYMDEPVEQTSYQWIRFTVVSALTLSADPDSMVIALGDDFDSTISASSGMSTTTSWEVSSVTLDGSETSAYTYSISNSVLTFTPSSVGSYVITVTASNTNGESDTVDLAVVVYSALTAGSDETITSIGSADEVSSSAVSNGSDISVSWSYSGTLPEGFEFDYSTGVISGAYEGSEAGSAEIVVTATSTTGGLEQTDSKTVTILYEPEVELTLGMTSVTTYAGNASDVEFAATFDGDTSSVTWSCDTDGVTVSDGIVYVSGDVEVTGGTVVTVSFKTDYGQEGSASFSLIVEDVLTISCDDSDSKVYAVVNEDGTCSFTVSGVYGFELSASTSAAGLTVEIDEDGCLTFSSASVLSSQAVTVTVTSDGGQTASCTVYVYTIAQLTFTSEPTLAVIAYAV